MSFDDNRRVHAVMSDGSELVRYDKAGKWYQEWPHLISKTGVRKRIAMTLGEVVNEAIDAAQVFYEKPGGASFDRRVRAARGEDL